MNQKKLKKKKTKVISSYKKVNKIIRLQSKRLDKETLLALEDIYWKCEQCKNYFYQWFSGINYMVKVKDSKKIRDFLKLHQKEHNYKFEDIYKFQNKHWIMVLFDVCANINSGWSHFANLLKRKIRDNKNLSQDEINYCNYILSVRELWYQVLTYQEFNIEFMDTFNNLSNLISKDRFHYLHNLIRRITRKYKFKTPHTKNLKCITLDVGMYKIVEDKKNNKTYIRIISTIPRKRIVIELKTNKYCYRKNGNIQLIFDKDNKTISIDKLITIKAKKNTQPKKVIGIDKGYTTLISTSENKEYGINIGQSFTKECERLNTRNSNRNYFFTKVQNLKSQILELSKILKTKKGKEASILQKQINELKKKLNIIETHNIGNKKYNKEHKKVMDTLTRDINYSIKKMYQELMPTIIAKEDLTFTTKNKHKGKSYNRKMAMWIKGILDKRLECIGLLNDVKLVDVNPAYTSQFCSKCGSILIKRKGTHHEIGVCPICGEIDANINAAINIKNRYEDSEISLYTPYLKVKDILLQRTNQIANA